ncbi:metal-dependent hydrolase [Methanothermobacter tenebrarum]|uniref:metal-dependent hydrolase n=1 Tax=Methanothermobacter tenebrarum TaxID=680118 RepID=UPI001FE40FB6|nr:metal-dependent hydrolase [Methanothermobacter tenebrarum]
MFALPFFFQNIFALALSVLGSSIPDLDHPIKGRRVSLIFLIGVLILIIFYLLGLPYLIGVLLMILAMIFYFSRHRGFSHSILGIFILSILLTLLVISSYFLFRDFGADERESLALILAFSGLMFINRKILIPFTLLGILGVLFTPFPGLNLYNIMGPFLLGFVSHVILDLYTHSGVKFLRPFSTRTFKKGLGGFLIIIWIICAGYSIMHTFF